MTIHNVVVNDNGSIVVHSFTNKETALGLYVELGLGNGCADTEEEISTDELEQFLINESAGNGSHNDSETYHISLVSSVLN